MESAKKYTELLVWQLATELKKEVYRLIRSGSATGDFKFRDQLRNSAASIPQHIVEGFGRVAPRDFARFISYAIGSMYEAEGWLNDGVDRGHWTEADLQQSRRLLRRLTPALRNLHRYLSGGQRQNQPNRPNPPNPPNQLNLPNRRSSVSVCSRPAITIITTVI